jgi:ribosomal protein S18 acetylase RimI-like enzyme
VAAQLAQTRSEAFFIQALQDRVTLVAEHEGRLVGYVQLGELDIAGIERRAGDQELHRLYVETGLHGRGIGRRLLRAALRHPRLARAPRVYLQVWERNEPAVALYRSAGFRPVGRTRFRVGAAVLEDVVMLLEPGSGAAAPSGG